MCRPKTPSLSSLTTWLCHNARPPAFQIAPAQTAYLLYELCGVALVGGRIRPRVRNARTAAPCATGWFRRARPGGSGPQRGTADGYLRKVAPPRRPEGASANSDRHSPGPRPRKGLGSPQATRARCRKAGAWIKADHVQRIAPKPPNHTAGTRPTRSRVSLGPGGERAELRGRSDVSHCARAMPLAEIGPPAPVEQRDVASGARTVRIRRSRMSWRPLTQRRRRATISGS